MEIYAAHANLLNDLNLNEIRDYSTFCDVLDMHLGFQHKEESQNI